MKLDADNAVTHALRTLIHHVGQNKHGLAVSTLTLFGDTEQMQSILFGAGLRIYMAIALAFEISFYR